MEPRPKSFYALTAFFVLFLIFLYGPTITIAILSFQGPGGGLTFPMRGVSLHWFRDLFEQQAVGDIWGSFYRSFTLGLMVMVTTVIVSVMGGLAFRKRFAGATILFLPHHHVTGDPVDPRLTWCWFDLVPIRHDGALVHVRLRGTAHLDLALWPSDHVRGLQQV